MVFSCGLAIEQFGWALAVPCRAAIDRFAQLEEEAEALWAAERKCSNSCGLAANWGVLLATPTVPKDAYGNRSYASPMQIASSFQRASDDRRYFDETRKIGISTAFDADILRCLESTG
jgi:hypothetical protein